MANLPAVAYALLDTIAGPESEGRYNVIYGGSLFDGYADHPRQYILIESGPHEGEKSSAAGRYQFLGSTWDRYARKLGLTDFSPDNQDLGAWELAQDVYLAETKRDLQTDLENGDVSRVPGALAETWTSLPGGIEQGITTGGFETAFSDNFATRSGLPPASAPIPQAPIARQTPIAIPAYFGAEEGLDYTPRVEGNTLVPGPEQIPNKTNYDIGLGAAVPQPGMLEAARPIDEATRNNRRLEPVQELEHSRSITPADELNRIVDQFQIIGNGLDGIRVLGGILSPGSQTPPEQTEVGLLPQAPALVPDRIERLDINASASPDQIEAATGFRVGAPKLTRETQAEPLLVDPIARPNGYEVDDKVQDRLTEFDDSALGGMGVIDLNAYNDTANDQRFKVDTISGPEIARVPQATFLGNDIGAGFDFADIGGLLGGASTPGASQIANVNIPDPAKRVERKGLLGDAPQMGGMFGVIQGIDKAIANASGPFSYNLDNALYNMFRGGDFYNPSTATHQGTDGFLFRQNGDGSYTNVGRAGGAEAYQPRRAGLFRNEDGSQRNILGGLLGLLSSNNNQSSDSGGQSSAGLRPGQRRYDATANDWVVK